MTEYDPAVIQKFADRMYARKAGAILVSTVLGIIIGLVMNSFIDSALPANWAEKLPEWTWAAVFGGIGVIQGMERAATLKLQAQTALCQMQIEKNTRRGV